MGSTCTNTSNTNRDKEKHPRYAVETTKTAIFRYSFFSRTVVDWNNLEDGTVCAETVDRVRSSLVFLPVCLFFFFLVIPFLPPVLVPELVVAHVTHQDQDQESDGLFPEAYCSHTVTELFELPQGLFCRK